MKTYNFPIVVEHDKDGYVASCPTLQGCYTQGTTYEEVIANIKDAIKLHLEDRQSVQEDTEVEDVSLATVQVAV